MAGAQAVVDTIKTMLADNPLVTEMTVDGIKVVVSHDALAMWERRAAREAGSRPVAATIDMSGGV